MNFSFKASNRFSGNFFKNMYKNKSIFNMFSSTTNSRKSFIYIQNKFFINRVLSLVNSNTLLCKSSISQLVTGQLKTSTDLDKEQTGLASLCLGNGLVLLNELLIGKHGNIFINK
jgi:hypothetical protein